jgi:hypothetical protein
MSRCYICNRILESSEIRQDKNKRWMPCSECTQSSYDNSLSLESDSGYIKELLDELPQLDDWSEDVSDTPI